MDNLLLKKLCLGTAQFGLDYGISNLKGRIPEEEVFEILNYALDNEIGFIDTAYDYGESEKVIGKFIRRNSDRIKIISKLPQTNKVYEAIDKTLDNLGIRKLYGYLIHNFNFFLKNPKVWEEVLRLKYDDRTEKVGFSLYYPEEYNIIKKLKFDILQIPYSIFDQRFGDLLEGFKEKGVEVYARSVFLQGLVFKRPEELNGKFSKLKERLVYLNALAKESNLSLSAIFLNFVVLNKNIDKVIIGIDSLENLKVDISSLGSYKNIKKNHQRLLELKETDEDIILPTRWKN